MKMEQRFRMLIFEYELFSKLFKYLDPLKIKEYNSLNLLIKTSREELEDIIKFYGRNSELGSLLYNSVNIIESAMYDNTEDLYDREYLYKYYFLIMTKYPNILDKYNLSLKRQEYIIYNNNIYSEPLRSTNTINTNNDSFYKLIIDITVSKFFLFIIMLSVLIVIIFCIFVNTNNGVDSISEHGTISNMVDLHSSFAISTKLLSIVSFISCLLLIVIWLYCYDIEKFIVPFKNYFLLNFIHMYFILYVISLIYSIYFIFTGLVWADFTWGGNIWKFESKMMQLWVHVVLNLLFCCVFFFYRKKSFFAIINLIIIMSIVAFFFFFMYDSFNQSFSVHQATDSLHLFLRFVGAGTGYYVIIFLIYLFFIVLSCLIMVYELQRFKDNDLICSFLDKSTNLY